MPWLQSWRGKRQTLLFAGIAQSTNQKGADQQNRTVTVVPIECQKAAFAWSQFPSGSVDSSWLMPGAKYFAHQLNRSPTADWPASIPIMPGNHRSWHNPADPGMFGNVGVDHDIACSAHDFTKVPGFTPLPTAPAWASIRPIATWVPACSPTSAATCEVRPPAN